MHNRETVQKALGDGTLKGFFPFYGAKSFGAQVGKECLSNHYICTFEEKGVQYQSVEQYTMAGKATLFNDTISFNMIMKTSCPKAAKKLGRSVKDFDEHTWMQNRIDIVRVGLELKFSQNPALAAFLSSTGNKVLIEASPSDTIWGVGLSQANPGILDMSLWRGENLLGFLLMEVRDSIS